MNAALERAKSVGTDVVAFVKEKPNTVAYCAWVVGCFVAPVTTVLASVCYTGWNLASNAGEEWSAELNAALEKRAAEKEIADVP